MFGTEYKKPTRFRVWGNDDFSDTGGQVLHERRCTLVWSRCTQALGVWGGLSTADAAVYPEALCKAYAGTIRKIMGKAKLTEEAEETVTVARHGRVHRHKFRGIDEVEGAELKKHEDDLCGTGLRNPADFTDKCGTMP